MNYEPMEEFVECGLQLPIGTQRKLFRVFTAGYKMTVALEDQDIVDSYMDLQKAIYSLQDDIDAFNHNLS